MAPAAPRIEVLAKRVRWLDRHHRFIAIALAAIVWLVLSRELAAMFQSDWPGVVPAMVGAMFAAAAWWIIEVAFAWTIALWETEHDQLARDKGLPRAQLVAKKVALISRPPS